MMEEERWPNVGMVLFKMVQAALSYVIVNIRLAEKKKADCRLTDPLRMVTLR